jgi:Abortive infection C-terminus
MDELSERIESLQNMLIAEATGGSGDEKFYQALRKAIVESPILKDIAPRFLRTCRTLSEFWQFIKYEYKSYAERRQFIWDSFRPLLERIEGAKVVPSDESVGVALQKFDPNSVHQLWLRAMERRESDPEGAITLARTLLETVCKHILDELGAPYERDCDLPALYKLASKSLNIAPSQHSEQIFKQILGGCTAVVEGLGALRNRLSDAHGQGKKAVRPAPRHAELAVNLSGAMATFLVSTH